MTLRLRLAWFWTLVIFFLCWLPRQYVPGHERLPTPLLEMNFDKLVHMGIFFVFAVLWICVKPSARQSIWIFLAGIALATITELGQENRIVNRDCSLEDGLADQAGVVLGIVGFWLIVKFWPGFRGSKFDFFERLDTDPKGQDGPKNSHDQANADRD